MNAVTFKRSDKPLSIEEIARPGRRMREHRIDRLFPTWAWAWTLVAQFMKLITISVLKKNIAR